MYPIQRRYLLIDLYPYPLYSPRAIEGSLLSIRHHQPHTIDVEVCGHWVKQDNTTENLGGLQVCTYGREECHWTVQYTTSTAMDEGKDLTNPPAHSQDNIHVYKKIHWTCQWKPARKVNCDIHCRRLQITANHAFIGTGVCKFWDLSMEWITLSCYWHWVKILSYKSTSPHTHLHLYTHHHGDFEGPADFGCLGQRQCEFLPWYLIDDHTIIHFLKYQKTTS